MKRKISFFIAVGMIFSTAITSCNKDKDMTGQEMIQMTTNAVGEVSISMNGAGFATIDWGDGSVIETQAIRFEPFTDFIHNYTISNIRTIRIYGENIDRLYCNNNQLLSLDVSKNTSLFILACSGNKLTSLDVSKNTELYGLFCDDNQLTSLDVSKNSLVNLGCSGNKLTNLDLSNNVVLRWLHCAYNQLMTLDVSKNSLLSYLSCSNNQLTRLDLSNNAALGGLNCYSNQMSDVELDALFSSLHNNTITGKFIYVHDNPGANNCNPDIATYKGWDVYVTERYENAIAVECNGANHVQKCSANLK